MHIDTLIEQRIKQAANIVEVISDFRHVRRDGVLYESLCPFHNDRHYGSFKIYPKDNTFHCFSCQAHGDSITYVMHMLGCNYPDALRYLANKYCIDIHDSQPYTPPVIVRKPDPIPELPTLHLPYDYVMARLDTSHDLLCNWMRSLPWDGTQRQRLEEVLKNYGVGHVRKGKAAGQTIFWQIDEAYQVRTGKVMRYMPDGHRDKTQTHPDWIHSILAQHGMYDSSKAQMRQTLFGMHLLNEHPGATVNIVESEKTAILAATYWGDFTHFIWMASGGMKLLNAEKLQPVMVQQRKIILYPDKDGIEEWRKLALSMKYDRISVNTYYLDHYNTGPKADIGDVIVDILQGTAKPVAMPPPTKPKPKPQSPPPKAKADIAADLLQGMMQRNPHIKTLVEKLDLEPITYTKETH